MPPSIPPPPVPSTPVTGPRARVRVASVPAGHVYVRHLAPETGDGPVRLADPEPLEQRSGPAQWWPPTMLRPEWVATHHGDFDLMHLHFGFDAWDPADLASLLASLRAHGKPLVYTVHDLRNPHHPDRAAHDAQLDVLVPGADALITLTPGAAAEIRRRWGREAVVVPHPHVVPLDVAARWRQTRRVGAPGRGRPFRVGLHLKSVRASMAPDRVLPTLVEVVRDLPDAVLQVNLHRDVAEASGRRHDPWLAATLARHADAGHLELHVHDFLDDDGLWTYLSSLDLSVLPYRFGTHSGWLEACRDLGTTVVAPTCGYLSEQGPVLTYVHEEDHYDADTLHAAVRAAYTGATDPGADVASRRAQRRRVAAAHDEIYARVRSGAAADREGQEPERSGAAHP